MKSLARISDAGLGDQVLFWGGLGVWGFGFRV